MTDPQQPVPRPTAPPVAPYSGPYATPAQPQAQAPAQGMPAAGAYAPPYTPPVDPRAAAALAAPPARRSGALGIVAVILAGLAAVTPLFGAIAAYRVGIGAGRSIASLPQGAPFDFSLLTPVREWVLMGEVAFWVGTVLGVWAIIQGVMAIVTRRGRIAGIVAIAIAVLAPIAFAVAVVLALGSAAEAGSTIGG